MDTPIIGRIVSVNVGAAREVEWGGRTVTTAILKKPVDVPVEVDSDGLREDEQADLRVHGGPDKAVYAYAVEDLAWWMDELGEVVVPGTFGENLTTEGVDVSGSMIGDRWSIGSAVFEVCQPRKGCFKLGLRMGDASFVDRFDAAHRPGAYLRVFEPGIIEKGDPVILSHRPDDELQLVDLLEAVETGDAELLHQISRNRDVTQSWRDKADRALRKTE